MSLDVHTPILPHFHTLHTLYSLHTLYLYCANTNSALDPTSFENMDSKDEDADTPPPMHIRWFHAGHGLAHLDLLATPIPVLAKATSAAITSWTAFSREESDLCEAGWHALSDEQRVKALADDPGHPVADPVINADDEVRQLTNQCPHCRTYFSPIRNRRNLYSVSPSEKSAFSRSISERYAYVPLISLFKPPPHL